VDHQDPGPPWVSLHCRPKEHIEAWPMAAPDHDGLPRLHRKDEELAGVQFRASPKTERRRDDRATAMKMQRWWRLVRPMLKRGERGRRAGGGAVEDNGVLPFL
jgi:hypothetical protein